jgi:hypothetical protein
MATLRPSSYITANQILLLLTDRNRGSKGSFVQEPACTENLPMIQLIGSQNFYDLRTADKMYGYRLISVPPKMQQNDQTRAIWHRSPIVYPERIPDTL